MSLINRKNLLEAGAHFGHKSDRIHPKMRKYVYGMRSGVSIIDLEKTVRMANKAFQELKKIVETGGDIIFVGTKKQACNAIKEKAESCGAFYVNTRWLGGTLTNFKTLRKSIDKLIELENMDMSSLPKKDSSKLTKQKEKLFRNFNGLRDMKRMPAAIFVSDINKDMIAITEARKLDIPVFAIADTDVNPDGIDYIIPGNDDAVRSLSLIIGFMSQAVKEGKNMDKEDLSESVEVAEERESRQKNVEERVESEQ